MEQPSLIVCRRSTQKTGNQSLTLNNPCFYSSFGQHVKSLLPDSSFRDHSLTIEKILDASQLAPRRAEIHQYPRGHTGKSLYFIKHLNGIFIQTLLVLFGPANVFFTVQTLQGARTVFTEKHRFIVRYFPGGGLYASRSAIPPEISIYTYDIY